MHAYIKRVLLPYGQSALYDQIINCPIDVDDILKQKPTFDAKSIVVVNKPGEPLPAEFVAHVKKVKDAVLYLKHHNPHYPNMFFSDLNLEPSVFFNGKTREKYRIRLQFVFFYLLLFILEHTIWPLASFRCTPVVSIFICYTHKLAPSETALSIITFRITKHIIHTIHIIKV